MAQYGRTQIKNNDDGTGTGSLVTAREGMGALNGVSVFLAGQLTDNAGTPGDAALIGRGGQLYEQGDAVHAIAACASCHGASAAGNSIFPRPAGPHAAYVTRQLGVIQHKFRDSPIMHGAIKALDVDAMKAVAEYLQSR